MSRHSFRHHPGESFQTVSIPWVGRRQLDGGQLLLDLFTEVVTPLHGLDLVDIQGAAHDEPHLAAVGDQPLDASGRQDQGIGREVARRAVVLDGTRQGRDVEQSDEVAVLVAVAGLPGVSW